MGVPSPTGVAVNVTCCPAHIGPVGFAVILTDGVTVGFTVTIVLFEDEHPLILSIIVRYIVIGPVKFTGGVTT